MAPTGAPGATATLHAVVPTRIVGGVGATDSIGDWVSTYGQRALVVIGDSHARTSGVLARIEASLSASGVEMELLEGVPGNPGVAVVDAGAALARSRGVDVVVGAGGGSVLDVAKAIATAAAGDGRTSFRTHLSGCRAPGLLVDAALPVVALPTLPGSGSETNGTSVITDDETGGKWSAHSDLAAPRVTLLDPALLDETPGSVLGPGLVDALCHALEAGLSTRASIASDAMAEQAVRTLRRDLAAACADPDDPDVDLEQRRLAQQRCWFASNLASQALTWAGSSVTHPLAHAVSAHSDARHGTAVAVLEPAVLTVLADRFHESGALGKIASWLDVREARGSRDAVLRGVLGRCSTMCKVAGITETLGDLGVDAAHCSRLVLAAGASRSRGLASVPGGEPSVEELTRIYELALDLAPIAPASKWIAAGERVRD